MCAKRHIQVRSCNPCCCGKAISITYSECMLVALVNQHAIRMRSTVMWSAWPLQYFFPLYLINGTIFKEKLLNTKCVS